MASSKEYLVYVLDLLRQVDGIGYKKMMGEYLLYADGVLFGGVYDDRFLIKATPYGKGLNEAIPYEGAKPMLLVDTDDPDEAAVLVTGTVKALRKGK